MIKIKNIEDILQSSEVLYNEPLRNYSFTKTGGNAEILVKINNEKDLQNVIAYSNENNIELTILGNGSNVLISAFLGFLVFFLFLLKICQQRPHCLLFLQF